MQITEVRVFLRNEEKLKAYVTVTFDNCFVVRDIKVIQGSNGLFISMPSKKRPNGTFKDIAHPLNNETRKMIETKVLEAYKLELEKPREERSKVTEDDVSSLGNTSTLTEDLEKAIENKISN
ncbi:MAG: septation regulator SpoVG [Candidatus Firestonebacteria bacterium]